MISQRDPVSVLDTEFKKKRSVVQTPLVHDILIIQQILSMVYTGGRTMNLASVVGGVHMEL